MALSWRAWLIYVWRFFYVGIPKLSLKSRNGCCMLVTLNEMWEGMGAARSLPSGESPVVYHQSSASAFSRFIHSYSPEKWYIRALPSHLINMNHKHIKHSRSLIQGRPHSENWIDQVRPSSGSSTKDRRITQLLAQAAGPCSVLLLSISILAVHLKKRRPYSGMLRISRIVGVLCCLSNGRRHGIGVMWIPLCVLRVNVLTWNTAGLLWWSGSINVMRRELIQEVVPLSIGIVAGWRRLSPVDTPALCGRCLRSGWFLLYLPFLRFMKWYLSRWLMLIKRFCLMCGFVGGASNLSILMKRFWMT